MKQQSAVARIGVALVLWAALDEWSRFVQPLVLAQLRPQPTMLQLMVVYALSGVCSVLGVCTASYGIARVGHRATATAACLATAAFIVCFGAHTAIILLAACQLLRVGYCFPQVMESMIGALYADAAEGKARLQAIVWVSFPQAVGAIIGPLLMYSVYPSVQLHGWDLSLAVAAVFVVLAIPAALYCLLPDIADDKRADSQCGLVGHVRSLGALLRESQPLRRVLLLRLLAELPVQSFETMHKYVLLYTQKLGVLELTLITIVAGFGILAAQALLSHASRQLHPQRILMLTLLGQMITCALLAAVSTGVGTNEVVELSNASHICQTLVLPVHMILCGIVRAVLTAQCLGVVPPADVARAAALNHLTCMLAIIIAPLLSGLLLWLTMAYELVMYGNALGSATVALAVHHLGHCLRHSHPPLLPAAETKLT